MQMNPVKSFEHGGKMVGIYVDQEPMNPRKENYNADKMICFHKRYNLGDKHDYSQSQFNSWDELEAQIISDYVPVAILPLYMYDHSGITISTSPFSCPWDSGQIGFVLITRETALKENNSKRVTKKIKDWAERYIKASVEEYDNYLTGDVYGYVIKENNESDEEIDSCWGFLGIEAVEQAAKEVIDA